ncbi:MAG TPA: hypothetical protein PLV52_01860 [Candidatus Omnitrophota bacterium]|nr:hypothetical protein [Candidatus Omnitrophota bacterium]
MKVVSVIRNIAIFLVAIILLLAGAIFFYRYQILQYSADAIIRKSLPPYIQVDKVFFEPDGRRVRLYGFKINNPPGFSKKYLLEIREVICEYKMRGKNILDGIEVARPVLEAPALAIERRRDGAINLVNMAQYIRESDRLESDLFRQKTLLDTKKIQKEAIKKVQAASGNKTFAELVSLPEVFIVKKGKLVVLDQNSPVGSHTVSLEDIDAEISLRLDNTYTKVLRAGSEGQGLLNGKSDEIIQWNSVYDPTTPRLTMGNRFTASGLDLLVFKPYYDKLSPFDFKRGRFSGTLVFDFDNGNIGSTNEIRLRDLSFSIKEGFEGSSVWGTPVSELARYFTSPQGDIVFDFKLKGDMSNPKMELGPISKRALTAMAVDKVSQVLRSVANQAKDAVSPQGEATPGKETDAQKAAKYIGIISELMSKQK